MTNKDQVNREIRKAIKYAIYANLAVSTFGAVAQAADAPGAAAAGQPLEEVVVTGSRIVQPGLESISPLITVSSQEIKAQGTTRVEDLLNNLPQVFADQGSNISNGSTGTAAVDLRGLGSQRTLVLVNGRRLMPGDPTQNGQSSPDLNQIPAALINHIDVLTGGASAVYGADAVAGVVNFVMEDNFQGVRIDANATMYNHRQHQDALQGLVTAKGFAIPSSTVNDGKTQDITVIIGGNFGDSQGNMTGYLGYRNTDPILQSQRDFSACTLNGGSAFSCGGSSTSGTGAFYLPKAQGGKQTVGANGELVPVKDLPEDMREGSGQEC